MPRIGDPSSIIPPSPTITEGNRTSLHEPAPAGVIASTNSVASTDRFERGDGVTSPFEVYFTPYDPAIQTEIALIDKILEARKADPTAYAPQENPYKINYAVYNLRSPEIINRLIEAAKSGVEVQVLIEAKQIAPESTWNKVDDIFEDAGLKVIYKDIELPLAERAAAHLVGIESNHLMHLKTRIYSYKDPQSGEIKRAVLSGSMNPGDGAVKNDENLNLIKVPSIIDLYEKKFDDVLNHRRTDNVWNDDQGLNVLFTPAQSGPRPLSKLFEWIDAEQEMIFLSVFDLKDLEDPASRKTLVQKLAEAKARGVEVAVITDRKKSDGLDAEGNRAFIYGRPAPNSWIDEDLQKEGIPVYEFVNESSEFSAVHSKYGIFGLSDMKVLTGAGNWTRAGMGSGNKRGRNEESFIFVESNKLDNNRTGMRYLSNVLYMLRNYGHQHAENPPTEEMIARLQKLPSWPQVEVDPNALLPPNLQGEVYLVGDHPALQGRAGQPGLKLSTRNTPFETMTREPISLPFGTILRYDVVKRQPDGSIQKIHNDASLLIVPPDNSPHTPKPL